MSSQSFLKANDKAKINTRTETETTDTRTQAQRYGNPRELVVQNAEELPPPLANCILAQPLYVPLMLARSNQRQDTDNCRGDCVAIPCDKPGGKVQASALRLLHEGTTAG